MIRKAIIVVLSLAAVGTGLVWAVSGVRDIAWTILGENQALTIFCFLGGSVDVVYFSQDPDDHPLTSASWQALGYLRFLQTGRYTAAARSHQIQTPAYAKMAGFPTIKHHWGFPLWFPLIFFGAYPTLAFIRGPLRRYRRRKRGLCVKCGYNLTGLTEPRCPECGGVAQCKEPSPVQLPSRS